MWLKTIKTIESKGKLEELKKLIGNKTLVGEYVGSPEHQHLVAYPNETIMFYAIVDHNSGINCSDPYYAVNFFNSFGLDHVEFDSKGVYSTLKEVRDAMLKTYIEVGKSSIFTEEEGIVMYVVRRSPSKIGDFTLSLCKIKTLEYRLYRKIRESLRNLMSKSIGIFIIFTKK